MNINNRQGHTKLELRLHPDRSFLSRLLAQEAALAPETLLAMMREDVASWREDLMQAQKAGALLQGLELTQAPFQVVQQATAALNYLEQGLALQKQGAWSEASTCYWHALNTLNLVLSWWISALADIADETPFDPYYPSPEERNEQEIPDPPRSSPADMRQVSSLFARVSSIIDRTLCLALEITQRQMTCLTMHMQTLEIQASATPEKEESHDA